MPAVNFIIGNRKSRSQECQIVVDINVRENGKRFHKRFKTPYLCPEGQWNEKTQTINIPRLRVASPEQLKVIEQQRETNRALTTLRADIEDALLCGFDEAKLNALFGQEEKTDVPEVVYLDEGLRQYAQNSDLNLNRKRHYFITANTILRWMEYNGKKVSPSDFSIKELENLSSFIEKEHQLQETAQYQKRVKSKSNKTLKRQGSNTINQKLGHLKTYLKYLTRIGELESNPFDRFTMRKERYLQPIILDWDEVEMLYNATNLTPKKTVQRDIFVFQCCLGCRVSDLERLTWDNVEVINGIYYVSYIPQKTSRVKTEVVKVALCSMAVEIVERYRGCKGWRLLPCVSTQKYNDSIKEILKDCGITRKVLVTDKKTGTDIYVPLYEAASSHLARRTCASDLNARGLTEFDICTCTGHTVGSKSLKRYIKPINKKIDAVMMAR